MLETIHLTKIYKTKGGADVKALDDVSIQFPETGMVFLLGKSGSGKSTLLNVCGGLDSPTLGAISVKGRTSTAFTQSDFDSYRNTFVGFIFQEYNILNEFTVEDNIALALELQGKKGRITVNGSEVTLWTVEEGAKHFSYETQNGIGKGYWGCGHQTCIRDFYRCLEENRRYQGDVKGVETTFETMMRIYEKGEHTWNR